jgi:uncharacterized protein YegL
MDYLNKTFKANPAKLVALFPFVEALEGWSDPAAVRALTRVAQFDAYPKTLGLRRCVVKSLIGIRHKDAVPALIELMSPTDGELLFQIGEYLNKITGEPYGTDIAGWKEWWPKNKDGFSYPSAKSLPPAKGPKAEQDGPRYYGLQIHAKRLIFVIDTSGSMAGPKLVNAKKELLQAIQKLSPKAEFNIIVFNAKVYVWSPKMVEATEAAKKRAQAFVYDLPVGGATVTYDALEAALNMRIESIYLLTDGEPTKGKIVRPPAIVAAIRTQNRLQGTSIHCIGLGVGPDAGIFSQFLKALSEQNHGEYRKVD